MRANRLLATAVISELKIKSDPIEVHSGTLNTVIEFEDHVLRVTPERMRSSDLVLDELNFLDSASAEITELMKPIQFSKTNLTKQISLDNLDYTIAKFERIEGKKLKDMKVTYKNIEKIGEITAKLHEFTKDYSQQIPEGEIVRFQWNEEKWIQGRYKFLKNDIRLFRGINTLIDEITQLEKKEDNFGLIHADINRSNIIVNSDKELKIIDFDDLQFNWFSYDFAATLENFSFFEYLEIEKIKDYYLKGYKSAGGDKDVLLEHFELFYLLRKATVYLFIQSLNQGFNRYPVKFQQALHQYREDLIDFAG